MAETTVKFLLNGASVALTSVDPNQTVLQYLRGDAGLCGTKEGCAEGDCGACVVAVGEPAGGGGDQPLRWSAVNSCIRLLSSIDGKAVVTVDALRSQDGTLHPVQQAFVQAHASQCGFCTPGFVMSLFARYQNGGIGDLTHSEVDDIFSGNLCRCTGYRPIIDAALSLRNLADTNIDTTAPPLKRHHHQQHHHIHIHIHHIHHSQHHHHHPATESLTQAFNCGCGSSSISAQGLYRPLLLSPSYWRERARCALSRRRKCP